MTRLKPLASFGTLVCFASVFPAVAWAGGGGHSVISNIAVCMVAASALGFVMKVTKQPLLLGYILAGVLIGPIGLGFITDESEVKTVAEIGLILLLFMIGLEIDLKKMLSAGKLVIVTGMVQFPICVGIAYLGFSGLVSAGIDVGAGNYGTLYAALAVGISSTMIVVKPYDKMEPDTLPGRITIGVLVFQDIWAIIVLAIQPNLSDPQILGILGTFASGAPYRFTRARVHKIRAAKGLSQRRKSTRDDARDLIGVVFSGNAFGRRQSQRGALDGNGRSYRWCHDGDVPVQR